MKLLKGFILAAALSVFLLGCGERNQEQEEHPDKVIVTYQTVTTSRLSGLLRIENAINEIAREEAGVEISFCTVDANDSFSIYPVWLSQGERIDLMVLNYQDIQSYIKNGQLMKLDSLLEQYGGGICELMDAGDNLTSGTMAGGSVYGIAVASEAGGYGGGLWVSKRCIEETGFRYDAEKIYTLDEVDDLLGRLKELYPDKYPLGQITSGNTFSAFNFFCGMQDSIGGGDISAIVDEATGRMINFYETEEYRMFLERMRKWFECDYIYPDAAYTGFSNIELMRSGDVLSIPLTSNPGIITAEDVGEEVVCLRLSEIVEVPNSSRGTFWVIPATCQNPENAMKFLNLMYTDARIVNLLTWGEEGRDYLFIDEEEGVISYPEGVTQDNADYNNPLGLYGDKRLAYSLGSNELKKQQENYRKSTKPLEQKYVGFFFDESSVSTEAWRVRQVLNRYLPVLECGCVDLEENYAAFLSALKEAGIETIIAERQHQLDMWLADQ